MSEYKFNPNELEQMKKDRNRARGEYEKDLLYYADRDKANYDRLVPRLMLDVLLDLRDQNERIIRALERIEHHTEVGSLK